MFKTTAVNSLAAVAAAVLVAGLVVFPAVIVPPANAEPVVQEPVLPPTIVSALPCSLQGWPYYERSCQFDRRTPATETRIVRVIALR